MSFNRKEQRQRRHLRLRQRVRGTAERPRMAIFLSNRHMYVQFIDDVNGRTLAATASGKDVASANRATAKQTGSQAAEVALSKGIRQVVVDRGGFRFHGRLKDLVEAAVAGGLRITNDVVGSAEVTK